MGESLLVGDGATTACGTVRRPSSPDRHFQPITDAQWMIEGTRSGYPATRPAIAAAPVGGYAAGALPRHLLGVTRPANCRGIRSGLRGHLAGGLPEGLVLPLDHPGDHPAEERRE